MKFNKKNVIREIDECIGALKALRSSERSITVLIHLRAKIILMKKKKEALIFRKGR